MKFKAVDLFCGAGGLSSGLKKSGFKICLGVDIDETALKTYKSICVKISATKDTTEGAVSGVGNESVTLYAK